MADKFKPGDKVTARWQSSNPESVPQDISVTVLKEETAGMYRCQTDMGTAILFKEEELHG